MKKITIEKSEEIELTENEERIYRVGEEEGIKKGVKFMAIIMTFCFLIMLLIIKFG